MKILVVEDEPKTGDYLKKGLTETGFVVDVARNGSDGCHLALTGDYELIVLDVMLPGMDGWQILRELRRQKDTPVLFLTARDRVDERVQGLELGADADLEVDVLKHRAWRAGTRIDLTAKEFSLLALFMRRRGEVLSRTLIAEQVWDMNFDSDTNVVDVAVRRLRAKVDDPFARKLIHTIRGVGYVLEERE